MLSEARATPAVVAALPRRRLPRDLPAIAMGSSLYAAQLVQAMGGRIQPIAAEDLLRTPRRLDRALLISQSGASREVVAAARLVRHPIVITNHPDSPLARLKGATVHLLGAPRESASSSVTWLASCALLARALGLVWRAPPARAWADYERQAARFAATIRGRWSSAHGMFLLGDGPYLPIARQIALVASEALKRPCVALSTAAFDHGPKEAAPACITWHLGHDGHEPARVAQLAACLTRHRAPWIAADGTPDAVACIATLTIARLATAATFVLGGKATF